MKRFSLIIVCLCTACGLAPAPTAERDICVYVREMVAQGAITTANAYFYWSECAPFPEYGSTGDSR